MKKADASKSTVILANDPGIALQIISSGTAHHRIACHHLPMFLFFP